MKTKQILLLTINFLLLTGFSGDHLSMPFSAKAWIDAPLDGSALPLAPYNVVSHATSPYGIASFELSVNGQVYRLDDLPADQQGMNLAFIYQEWLPPAPGLYHLSVRAVDLNGDFGFPDDVNVEVEGMVEGKDDVPMPTPTDTPTPEVPQINIGITPTYTSTPTPETCTFTAKVNLFCRKAPGFPEIDSFVPGQSAPVTAMSTDGYYLYVLGANFGRECSVPSDEKYGNTSGDCDTLLRYTPAPTPLPTNTPTFTPEPEDSGSADSPVTGCTVRDASGVIICQVPCPRGATPGDACTP
jgi:hypothetical protein